MAIACAYCNGDGETTNPANLNPHRAIEDWLPPVVCGRCGGSGWDPTEDHPATGYVRHAPRGHLRVIR